MAGLVAISLNEENQPRLVEVAIGVVGEGFSIGAGGRERSGRCMLRCDMVDRWQVGAMGVQTTEARRGDGKQRCVAVR